MKTITFLFLTILLLPNHVQAFSYDFLDSGISLKEAKDRAKSNNIRLILDKNSHDVVNKVRSNSAHYKATLFNRPVNVSLVFTHRSNLLYKINVSWRKLTKASSKRLYFDVAGILKKKYGMFERTSGKSIVVIKGERCDGSTEGYFKRHKGDEISLSLSTCFNSLNLSYINDSLKQIHQKEALKTGNVIRNDANKL